MSGCILSSAITWKDPFAFQPLPLMDGAMNNVHLFSAFALGQFSGKSPAWPIVQAQGLRGQRVQAFVLGYSSWISLQSLSGNR